MLPRIATLAFILLACPATAQDGAYPMTPLLSTGATIIGEPIRYPTTGPAKVTAAIITIAPGEKTGIHKHGVPLFAYILDGEFTENYGEHGRRHYKKGDAFMEATDAAHFGVNNGTQPVRVLAVYMGAAGAADVIPVK